MKQFFAEFANWTQDDWIKHDELVNARLATEKTAKKQRALADSGIGTRFLDERLETYAVTRESQKALETVRSFLTHVQCGSFSTLVLCGNPGTGKTHLAASLLYELGGEYRLSDQIREEYEAAKSFTAKRTQDELIRHYGRESFLVIDEIGRTESAASGVTEKHCLYRIINERYNSRLPTVFISNLMRSQFMSYVGAAAMDRLTESAVFCECSWESYRLKKRGA